MLLGVQKVIAALNGGGTVMPKSNVHAIFEQFVGSLSALIKEKVYGSVNAATTDFLAAKFGTADEEPKPVRRRRRKRRSGRNPEEQAAGKPGRKRGVKSITTQI